MIMTTRTALPLLLFLASLAVPPSAFAAVNYSVSAGGRYHVDSTVLPDLPYAEDDWSSLITFDVHEGAGYWQMGVDIGYGAGTNDNVSLVLTPQINLLAEDKGFVGGLGILGTFIQDDEAGDDWTDVYYQFSLGYDFRISGGLAFGAMAHYPFADWGDLGDFDTDDLEYSASLRFRF